MTDLSDNTGSSDLPVLLPDAAVEAMDDSKRAEAVCVPVEESKKAAREIEADFSKREHKIHRFPARARAVCVPVEELKKVAGEIEADFSKREQKIHRFPASVRPLLGRYIEPMCVAIGPYHRGLPQVQEMEKGKHAAAYHFTRASGCTLEEVHATIRSVVDEARSLYADDVTAGIEDPEFVAIMFHDACFLLEFMDMCVGDLTHQDPSLQFFVMCKQTRIINRDIMLLENQLPWLVAEILMSFKSVLLQEFLVGSGRMFGIEINFDKETPLDLDSNYKPPHLLALFRSYLIGGNTAGRILPDVLGSVSPSLSATKLEEIGISLTASKTSKFMDIGIKKGHLTGKFFLPPLWLDSSNACWLVNMTVFEQCMAPNYLEEDKKTIVRSYFCLLATLMDREDDLYELRRKSILQGGFTDRETLQFFKSLVKYMTVGTSYIHIMNEIEAYMKNRWIRIKLHTFIHNHFKSIKSIATVLSIIGVLAGIFKTLLSIKQHQ